MISKVFRDFIDTHDNGLGIIELPTSIGKTYSTFECIAKYAEDWSLAVRKINRTAEKSSAVLKRHTRVLTALTSIMRRCFTLTP